MLIKHEEIPFDPINPFPLYSIDSYTYQAAKNHSEFVDQWLGLDTDNIEKSIRTSPLSQLHQTWSEISTQSFQTPYCEIRSLLSHLKLQKGQKIIDLGCAYGRMAFVLGRHYPEVDFIGYEICQERVQIAGEKLKDWNFQNCHIFRQDLTAPHFKLSPADIYFIYDYGHNKAIQKTLNDLKTVALDKSIHVIARGRAVQHYIQTEHAWLCQVNTPEHFEHFSIYQS